MKEILLLIFAIAISQYVGWNSGYDRGYYLATYEFSTSTPAYDGRSGNFSAYISGQFDGYAEASAQAYDLEHECYEGELFDSNRAVITNCMKY